MHIDFQPLDHPARQARLHALKQALGSELCARILITDKESLQPFECDGLAAYQQTPMAVALPTQREDIIQVLQACRTLAIPLVTRGAGTGLSGGALPHADGLLLVMSRMNRILELDPERRCARVQPGVRNLAISQAAAAHNLYYAPDPSSQIACSIGGNVAENAGGVHCLKYGLTLHNVLALTVITIDGEILELGGANLDHQGPDLMAAFIGSEGLLGVVIDVLVKLTPSAEITQVLMAHFDDIEAAGSAVAAIIAAGIIPAGLEMMDQLAIRAAEDFLHAGYPTDAVAILLCELDGTQAQVEEEMAAVERLIRAQGAVDARIARDDQERAMFWAGRKNAFPAVGRISPDYYCMDGTIPRRHLGAVLKQINALSEQYGLAVANVFHAGDGNLHPLILFNAAIDGELANAEALGAAILRCCVEHGGSITGEHGVGIEKINEMCVQFTEQELAQMHAFRAAFDPEGLMNPGKAVPTLHRCAEFGAMHVHQGALPHPELPRF